MLHDVDETLKELILKRGGLNPREIEVAFDQPTSEWAARLNRPTINCWCFDLRENVRLRRVDMRPAFEARMRSLKGEAKQEVAVNGVGENAEPKAASLAVPPLRMDLTYLVTAWAREVSDEHQLLWRALGAMTQTTSLAPEDCVGAMQEQPYTMPITVAQMEDSFNSMVDLWSVLENQMRLGFTVRLTVALDPQRVLEAPFVLERSVKIGQASDPLSREIDAVDDVDLTWTFEDQIAAERDADSENADDAEDHSEFPRW